jgi:cobyrinic acid a,c-diamide synthase
VQASGAPVTGAPATGAPVTGAPATGAGPAWRLTSGALEGHVAGSVAASYLHTHWAGHPAAAARFTAACTRAATP